jgi:hypothetical protein
MSIYQDQINNTIKDFRDNNSNFKATYLYIKQHSVTGKLYFGKTIQNPEKYLGSGRYWKAHIKKHGEKHVINLWYCLFLEVEDIVEFAISFSYRENIVESDIWLNAMEETGLGVCKGSHHSEQHKRNIGLGGKGRKCSEETKERMRNKIITQEFRDKMSEIAKNRIITETRRKNIGLRGKKLSQEHKDKISTRKMGVKKGEETKAKMSAYAKTREFIKCSCLHCKKEFSLPNFTHHNNSVQRVDRLHTEF